MILDIVLGEMSGRERQVLSNITYMWNLRNKPNEMYRQKQKQTRHRKQTSGYQGEREAGRDKLGAWDEQIQTTVYQIDNQQGFTV